MRTTKTDQTVRMHRLIWVFRVFIGRTYQNIFRIFTIKQVLTFHANCLHRNVIFFEEEKPKQNKTKKKKTTLCMKCQWWSSRSSKLIAMLVLHFEQLHFITCTSKNWFFSDKNFHIFHISAQNIDCGYSLELPRFWAEIKKIMYTPLKPSFTI